MLDIAEAIGRWLLVALVQAVNLLVAAIGTLLHALLSLLPSMPTAPDDPVAPWVGWLNWLFPIAPLLAGLAAFVGIWSTFLVIRIGLRWAKAL